MSKPIAKHTLKVMEYIKKHPNATAFDVAMKFNMHKSRIYQLRKRIKDEEATAQVNKGLKELTWTVSSVDDDDTPGPTPEHEAQARASSAILDAKRTQKELEERLQKYFPGKTLEEQTELAHAAMVEHMRKVSPKESTNVDTILDSRAKDYGKFIEGAEIMQMLKRLVHNYIEQRGTQLAFDQREAIDMIIHKLGRIINGNPDKVDHWTDIAGYAKLVADRLEGNVR